MKIKSMDNKLGFERENQEKFHKISKLFSYPILEASIMLGMEMQEIRNIIKQNGISRWPYSYKRKKENSLENGFLKFSVVQGEFKPQIVKKVSLKPKICKVISKVEVKNLLNYSFPTPSLKTVIFYFINSFMSFILMSFPATDTFLLLEL